MLHLRIVTPPDRADRVLEILCEDPAVWNVIVLPAAAIRPSGDVVLADVAREDASVIITRLRELGLEADGSIAVESVDTAISDGANAAIEAARGEQSDAVVWEQVEAQTSEQATLSVVYLAFMVLASAIAAAGIFTDSPILIVGAMVLGPEFGPLAGICVAAVQRRPALVRASVIAFVAGVGLAIVSTYLLSEALIAGGVEPDGFSLDSGLARLISRPRCLLGARRGLRRHSGDALADDGEVRRTDRRPGLGDDDPGDRRDRGRDGQERRWLGGRRRRAAGRQRRDDHRRRGPHAGHPA